MMTAMIRKKANLWYAVSMTGTKTMKKAKTVPKRARPKKAATVPADGIWPRARAILDNGLLANCDLEGRSILLRVLCTFATEEEQVWELGRITGKNKGPYQIPGIKPHLHPSGQVMGPEYLNPPPPKNDDGRVDDSTYNGASDALQALAYTRASVCGPESIESALEMATGPGPDSAKPILADLEAESKKQALKLRRLLLFLMTRFPLFFGLFLRPRETIKAIIRRFRNWKVERFLLPSSAYYREIENRTLSSGLHRPGHGLADFSVYDLCRLYNRALKKEQHEVARQREILK